MSVLFWALKCGPGHINQAGLLKEVGGVIWSIPLNGQGIIQNTMTIYGFWSIKYMTVSVPAFNYQPVRHTHIHTWSTHTLFEQVSLYP